MRHVYTIADSSLLITPASPVLSGTVCYDINIPPAKVPRSRFNAVFYPDFRNSLSKVSNSCSALL